MMFLTDTLKRCSAITKLRHLDENSLESVATTTELSAWM